MKEHFGEVMAQMCSHGTECTAFPALHQSQCPVLPYTLNVGYRSISGHRTDTHLMISDKKSRGIEFVSVSFIN